MDFVKLFMNSITITTLRAFPASERSWRHEILTELSRNYFFPCVIQYGSQVRTAPHVPKYWGAQAHQQYPQIHYPFDVRPLTSAALATVPV